MKELAYKHILKFSAFSLMNITFYGKIPDYNSAKMFYT